MKVERQFTPAEQIMLTLMISVINTFNRFGVGFRLGDETLKQAAFLRWLGTDRTQVLLEEAYLRRIVTRLCLDQIKSARHQRETYIGP